MSNFRKGGGGSGEDRAIETLQEEMLWWVNLGWLPHAHPAAVLLSILNAARVENKMEKSPHGLS